MKLKDQDDENGTFQMSIFDDVLLYYTSLTYVPEQTYVVTKENQFPEGDLASSFLHHIVSIPV